MLYSSQTQCRNYTVVSNTCEGCSQNMYPMPHNTALADVDPEKGRGLFVFIVPKCRDVKVCE